ncbi:hypothetical protein I4U23_007678 [Adineta vaga]|nr:hypothetical protein I4U23_007678 [Adineta vaga]
MSFFLMSLSINLDYKSIFSSIRYKTSIEMPKKPMNSVHNDFEITTNDRSELKRVSSTTKRNKQSGSTAKRYKSLLICGVCEGDAHGYNFDAITCESCKAFFRRNALRPIEKLKCHGNGQCSVKHNIRKRCKKCRMMKCIDIGMRKEWILTDKEREEKRAKIEENRQLRETQDNHLERFPSIRSNTSDSDLSLDLSLSFEPELLNEIDWLMIRFIQDYYVQAVKLNEISGIAFYPLTQPIESTEELLRIPLYISAMRLINYIKQTNEFQQLTSNDQLYLIKSNLLTTCFFHSIFIYDPRTDCYHEENTTDPLFSGKDWVKTFNKHFHIEMKQLRKDFIDIFQLDDIVIKLFLLIIIFSTRIPLNECREYSSASVINNSLDIFKAQSIFVDLVYRYCINQYGTSKGCTMFSRYILKLMKLQDLVDAIKHGIDNYVNIEQVSPLMRSLLV